MATIAGVKLANMSKPKESLSPSNTGKISPDPYSYEHRISLDQNALQKMGVAGAPKVGDVFHVMGEGHVHSVNSDSDSAGQTLRVGLQMRKMGMKPKAKGGKGGALDAVNKGIKEANE